MEQPVDTIVCADALEWLRTLPDEFVNCIITSPPYYGLRDYGVDGQLGLEDTPEQYVARLVEIFAEARRVLCSDGTLWLNLGDSYAGSNKGTMANGTYAGGEKQYTNSGTMIGALRKTGTPSGLKPKDLIGIPWRVAFALQGDGWVLRSEIIWHKPNPMPESVKDRPTRAHEYVFLLTKSLSYWYDADAIAEPSSGLTGGGFSRAYAESQPAHGAMRLERPKDNGTRNRRSVWTVTTEPTPFAHFATFPQKLIEPMVLAGCPANGIVLDPFMGSGTTALVARRLGRHYLGCDINAEYVRLANERLAEAYTLPLFA